MNTAPPHPTPCVVRKNTRAWRSSRRSHQKHGHTWAKNSSSMMKLLETLKPHPQQIHPNPQLMKLFPQSIRSQRLLRRCGILPDPKKTFETQQPPKTTNPHAPKLMGYQPYTFGLSKLMVNVLEPLGNKTTRLSQPQILFTKMMDRYIPFTSHLPAICSPPTNYLLPV